VPDRRAVHGGDSGLELSRIADLGALLGTDGWLGLRGWQWMFILEAAPAVLFGLACLAVLSDRPADARWLAADERRWLLAKLQAQAGQPRPVGQLTVRQVLANKHVLVLSVVLAGSTAVSSGLQLWQPQIIKSYGLTNMQTGLLNAIPFALASVIMIWWGSRSDRTGERIWHASVPLMLTAVSLASALLFTSLSSIVVILCLAVIGIYAGKGRCGPCRRSGCRRERRPPVWRRSMRSAILPGSARPT